MAKIVAELHVSYSQLCIFCSSLDQPFNDWSERSYAQGFAWREGSCSFRSLVDECRHDVTVFIDEHVPELDPRVERAFKVPFDTADGLIEIASVSDSMPLEINKGRYSLQVEFLSARKGERPRAYIRLNRGEAGFAILKADDGIQASGELDIDAAPAT